VWTRVTTWWSSHGLINIKGRLANCSHHREDQTEKWYLYLQRVRNWVIAHIFSYIILENHCSGVLLFVHFDTKAGEQEKTDIHKQLKIIVPGKREQMPSS
jgi:hypothetical protein